MKWKTFTLLYGKFTKIYHNWPGFIEDITKNILVCFFRFTVQTELNGVNVDGYASACCDLDLDILPFDLIGIFQAQVHARPNCGEIISNGYRDIVFSRFFGSLPAVP